MNKLITRKHFLHFHKLMAATALLCCCVTGLSAQDDVRDDILFRAMQDELTRSVSRLSLENRDRPYFVEYRVLETEGYGINASFGAIVSRGPHRNRQLGISVRLGDYDFDNTGFFSRDDLFSRFRNVGTDAIVLDNDYMALRRDFWLATDREYKNAVQQLAGKEGYLKSRVSEDTLADFSHEERVELIEPRILLAIDTAELATKVRRWSALFREYPDIDQSSVGLNFSAVHRYIMNSEQTSVRTGTLAGELKVTLSTHADDGATLLREFTLQLSSPDDLPSDKEMEEQVRLLVDGLVAQRNAPALEETYIGPVLLVDQAAPQFLLWTFVPHLSGSRLPLLEDESFGNLLGTESGLVSRMNRRVMPRDFIAYDDPTISNKGDVILKGNYAVDDQGVMARRVSLVENGVLKDLLSSRRPGKRLPGSNGHGRGITDPGATISNLFVETSEPLSEAEMKALLIEACRELEIEYGIMIRKMSPSSSNSFSGGGVSIVMAGGIEVPATEAYKVYVEDGREEPVRGVEVGDLDLRTLKDIMAGGEKGYVLNTGVSPKGIMDFSSVDVSIVAPSLLLEEIELNPSSEAQRKPPLLSHPYFED